MKKQEIEKIEDKDLAPKWREIIEGKSKDLSWEDAIKRAREIEQEYGWSSVKEVAVWLYYATSKTQNQYRTAEMLGLTNQAINPLIQRLALSNDSLMKIYKAKTAHSKSKQSSSWLTSSKKANEVSLKWEKLLK